MKNTYKVEVESGTTKWFNEVGQYHRIEGPAVEYADGNKSWYLNGKQHREGGPAFEWADGRKSWFLNGELHREGGPAIEYANGRKWWFLNGKQYTEAQHNAEMQKRGSTCNGKIVQIDGKSYTLTEVK